MLYLSMPSTWLTQVSLLQFPNSPFMQCLDFFSNVTMVVKQGKTAFLHCVKNKNKIQKFGCSLNAFRSASNSTFDMTYGDNLIHSVISCLFHSTESWLNQSGIWITIYWPIAACMALLWRYVEIAQVLLSTGVLYVQGCCNTLCWHLITYAIRTIH